VPFPILRYTPGLWQTGSRRIRHVNTHSTNGSRFHGSGFSAGDAGADQVSWSYTSSGGSLGNETDLASPPWGGWREFDYLGIAPTSKLGSRSINLIGDIVENIVNHGNGDFLPVNGTFGVGLQITDLASKQTGTVGFQFYGNNASCFLSETNPQ
jgi:hypothetical protein